MPQGKGTYGSKVGRPPKKKYYGGGSVDPFSTRNAKGVPAEQIPEAMENQNMANQGIPTANAPDRLQTSPDVTEYNEGGKVKSDRQRNLEGAKARLESAKKGRYYDVASKTVKTHKDEKKKQKTIERAEHSVKHYGG